ncbi:G5 domain-containing protein [Domibacillus aminovorans]|uniref:G5 domain-containing protein n=1 Tax=Domibacillus aminovorans TaxID=29332 RepID=A0A177LAB1_9BACI|nr:G5 domain-containing protein [Domibacillus aminovorans]OAH62709.1 hypothetical protein AWH49_08565 [Domibacillus aminovorans]
MKKKETVKIAAMFMMLTLYFIGFSYYGTAVYEKFFQSNERFDEGTMIGSESFDHVTKVEAMRTLTEKVTAWQLDRVLTFQYVEKSANISTNLIEFQIEKSIEKAVTGQKSKLYTTVSAERLQAELDEQFPLLRDTTFDIETLTSDIADIGDYLKPEETIIDLTLYMNEEAKQSIAAEALTGTVSEPLAAFIKTNSSIPVKSGDVVSFNKWLSSTQYGELDNESINILSSALYRLVMQTNFVLLEKNQSIALPDDLELGYEAKVDQANDQDFIFLNENNTSYTVEWKVLDGKLYGVLKGMPFYYTYMPVLKNKAELPTKTILQFDPSMPYGTTRVERFGESGVMIDVYRQTREGTLKLKEEKVAEDFYLPVHQFEWHSTQDPPPESEPKPVEPNVDSEMITNQETDPNANTETDINTNKETDVNKETSTNAGTDSTTEKEAEKNTIEEKRVLQRQ